MVYSTILQIVSTLENTNSLSFFIGLQHQYRAIVESVAKIMSSTFEPIDFATRYISSVPNMIANNSFRGTVAFINLDLDATSAQLQVESFSFLPAYTVAPPAVIAASVKQINLIPDTESRDAYS